MIKKEQEDFIKKLLEPTIDNAIQDMKMSKLLFLTAGNKFYSCIADEYMRDKEKFLPFIMEEKREEFISKYAQIFQEVGIVNDAEIAFDLQNWEDAGYIMMLLSNTTDWNSVDKLLHLQGHSKEKITGLALKVLYFSPYGLDFIEHIWGTEERIRAEKKIAKIS